MNLHDGSTAVAAFSYYGRVESLPLHGHIADLLLGIARKMRIQIGYFAVTEKINRTAVKCYKNNSSSFCQNFVTFSMVKK